MTATFADDLLERAQAAIRPLPSNAVIGDFLDTLLGLMFPQRATTPARTQEAIQDRLGDVCARLTALIAATSAAEHAESVAAALCAALPDVCEALRLDADAILAGDPAAETLDEVIVAYPGFQAIATHRVAHALRKLNVPLLPRLLAEVAHSRTGIDIHPGAQIGRACFIDHGTGVVIGETAVVGADVKIYQGVTLGALSVSKSARGTKRHPTIEDRVVLYAHATVLGGDTVIGHDSIIGGNVWLTATVPPFSFVHQTSQARIRPVADLVDPSDYSI